MSQNRTNAHRPHRDQRRADGGLRLHTELCSTCSGWGTVLRDLDESDTSTELCPDCDSTGVRLR